MTVGSGQPDPPALSLEGIDFGYGQVQVLFDVTVAVGRGETLALLGTNGAGKSTALRVAAGLEAPSRGTVSVNGQVVTRLAAEQRIGRGIRLLPGGRGVFPDMTVADNLVMGGFSLRRDRRLLRERSERVYELFPTLVHHRNHRADALSGGQQQMLALGIALLHDPEVLLIDELSLGLAPVVVQDLLRKVQELAAGGVAVVIVEQSLNVAAAIAERAVFMEKGHVRYDGPTHELIERDDLARAVFLGDPIRR